MKLVNTETFFKLVHPEDSEALVALKEYLDNMYFC